MKMKKLIALTTAFTAIALSAVSQPYGQAIYPFNNSFLSSGNVTKTTPGLLMAGYTPVVTPGNPNFYLNWVGPGGGLGGSVFQAGYTMMEGVPCISPTGWNIVYNCAGISAIETNITGPNPAVLALAGAYDKGVFFSTVNSLGVNVSSKVFYFPTVASNVSKPLIIESTVYPQTYYIVCQYDDGMYAMRVDALGNLIWGQQYNHSTPGMILKPEGMIEDPVGPRNLVIVGRTSTPAATNRSLDGLFLKLNNSTGAIVIQKGYGDPNGSSIEQWFYDIKPSNSGLIMYYTICGWTLGHAATPWVTKLNGAGSIVWSNVLVSSLDPLAINVPAISKRVNTLGATEYYVGANSANFGEQVFKIDANGNPVAGTNEFVYNTNAPGNPSSLVNVDFQDVPSSNIALSTFGTNDVTTGQYSLVRSYFSGQSSSNASCLETLTTAGVAPGPNTICFLTLQTVTLSQGCSFYIHESTLTLAPIAKCSTISIQGGSNARPAATQISENSGTEANGVSLFPNPTDGTSMLTYSTDHSTNVTIEIYNSIGQLVDRILSSQIQAGTHEQKIDFPKLNLETGIYSVNVAVDGKTTSKKIVYNK